MYKYSDDRKTSGVTRVSLASSRIELSDAVSRMFLCRARLRYGWCPRMLGSWISLGWVVDRAILVVGRAQISVTCLESAKMSLFGGSPSPLVSSVFMCSILSVCCWRSLEEVKVEGFKKMFFVFAMHAWKAEGLKAKGLIYTRRLLLLEVKAWWMIF